MNDTEKTNNLSRRQFLSGFSLMAGTFLLASRLPWIQEINAQDTGRTVRLGVIGVGSRGQLLSLFLKEIPGLNIACYCDNYQPSLNAGLQLFGPQSKPYTDHRDMLAKENLDAVVIATPMHEHAHIVIDSLNAGVHVFCEKSMALSIEDCNNMVLAAQKANKILLIGHQRMFDLKYQLAYKMIEEGKLGPVTHIRAYWHRNNDWRRPVPDPSLERKINWRLYKEYSHGLMTELASHQVQVANQILKEVPECVWGAGSINYWKGEREVYDTVSLVYKYKGGTNLLYDSISSNMHYGLEEQILGPKGSLELEKGKFWEEFPPPPPGILQMINHIENKIFDAIPIGGPSWVPETAVNNKGSYILDKIMDDDGTRMEMEAFVNFVRNNEMDIEYTKQGFYSSICVLMGHQAMQENRIVYWPEGLAL